MRILHYPRYRPYRKATNCFAPRIRFLTFSSATPACCSCRSNRLNASFNSFLNSRSITRSSTLGISSSPIDKLASDRSLPCLYDITPGQRPSGNSIGISSHKPVLMREKTPGHNPSLYADLQSPSVKKRKTWLNSGLRQDRLMHENGRKRCN